MFNYFLEQYADVTRRQVVCEAELASMRAANEEFNKHDDFGGGFSQDPFSSATIKHKEEEIIRIAEEVKDAHAILIFMRDRFLEGMI